MPDYAFKGRIDKLEIARGHDGLFRGPPEPVVLFGIYATDGSNVRLLGRSLHRFSPPKAFPSEVTASDAALPSSAIQTDTSFAFVGLALALEEDGGADIQRMFGAFERHEAISVWTMKQPEVEPVSIAAVREKWRTPGAVELCIDGTPAASTCKSDKWIGAVCWAMPPRSGAPVSIYRLPFLAPDGRNDWTALTSVAH